MATKGAIRNFHLPLAQAVYEALCAEAASLRQPATVVAREAIEAGTAADLDPSLESAALELLRGRKPRR